MKRSRLIGSTTIALGALAASILYMSHPAKSSDHQDTYNLATQAGHNTTADITDVYVYPSPSNPNNVVLVMNTAPLTPAGMGTSVTFDPTLLWQFKISHAPIGSNPVEDQVIQFTASGTGTSQTINVYGPAAPNEVGTNNTLVAKTASIPYNPTSAQSAVTINGQQAYVFAGPRADPFTFDLLAFFTFLGDRNYGTHTAQSDAGPGTPYNGTNAANVAPIAPAYDKAANPAHASFNGFVAGTMSNSSTAGHAGTGGALGVYACSTNPATNTLTAYAGGFNVESFVIEVPKSLLIVNGNSTIRVWATVGSSTTTS